MHLSKLSKPDILILLALASAGLAQDAAPLKLTLRDAVNLALKQNPQVILANLDVAHSEQERLVARSGLLPQAAADVSETVHRVKPAGHARLELSRLSAARGALRDLPGGRLRAAPVFDLTLWRALPLLADRRRSQPRPGNGGARGERAAGGFAISGQPARGGGSGGGAIARGPGAGALRPGGRPAEERRGHRHRYAARQRAAAERKAAADRGAHRAGDLAVRVGAAAQCGSAPQHRTGRPGELLRNAAERRWIRPWSGPTPRVPNCGRSWRSSSSAELELRTAGERAPAQGLGSAASGRSRASRPAASFRSTNTRPAWMFRSSPAAASRRSGPRPIWPSGNSSSRSRTCATASRSK